MEIDDASRLLVKYQGTSANQSINLKHIVKSLNAIDRLNSIGLMTVDSGLVPKSRTKSPVVTRLAAVRPGSVEFEIFVQVVGLGVSQSLNDVSVKVIHGCVRNWLNGVFSMLSGKNEHQEYFNRALDTVDRAIDVVKDANQSRHKEIMQSNHILERVVMGDTEATDQIVKVTQGPTKSVIHPVSKDCDHISIGNKHEKDEICIDGALASAIRNRENLGNYEKIEEVTVFVDGFIHSAHQLKVIHPTESDRILTAVIEDYRFHEKDNIYIDSAVKRAQLTVNCRTIYKDGKIDKLYISDARLPDK